MIDIDKIIHAVTHWADDIPDPVNRIVHIEMDALVDAILEAYAGEHGLRYPEDVPAGRARLRIKFENGDKYGVNTEWF